MNSSNASSPPTSSSPGEASPGGDALDLRGEVCPFTFVKAKLRLEEMAMGDTLWVVVDYEPASRNIPRSAREWGQDVLSVDEVRPGIWRIGLRKRAI